jgi:phage terminase large subunit-like protein
MYPQVFCAATVEKQARIVLKSSMRFIQTDEDLNEEFQIQEYKSLITAKRTFGEILAVGRDSENLDGIRPYFMSIDEYHAHRDNQLYEVAVGGQVDLDECLLSAISTAGFRLNGPCKEHYDYCVNIISGVYVDETQFVYIATPNAESDVWSEECWQMANPLWSEKRKNNIMSLAAKAKAKGGSDLKNFITKTCNMWYASSDKDYLNKEKRRQCGTDRTIEDMTGRECVLGLDLSSGGDLTSGNLEFELRENDRIRYYIHSHSFMPENRLAEHVKSDDEPYDVYEKQGLLTTTSTLGGYKTDYKYIITYYKELIAKYELKLLAIGYDPHNASAFLSDLEEFGVPCIEVVQSCKSLNEATVDFKNTVDALDVEYDKQNILLYHTFNNAGTTKNSFNEQKLDKEHATERIDPCSAAICSHKVIMSLPEGYNAEEYADGEFLDQLWGK